MHIVTIVGKESLNSEEYKEVYMGGFQRRKENKEYRKKIQSQIKCLILFGRRGFKIDIKQPLFCFK